MLIRSFVDVPLLGFRICVLLCLTGFLAAFLQAHDTMPCGLRAHVGASSRELDTSLSTFRARGAGCRPGGESILFNDRPNPESCPSSRGSFFTRKQHRLPNHELTQKTVQQLPRLFCIPEPDWLCCTSRCLERARPKQAHSHQDALRIPRHYPSPPPFTRSVPLFPNAQCRHVRILAGA